MAKIKTKSYEFDGKKIDVNFNCSSAGIFSASLNVTIVEKLNLTTSKLSGTSLREIEELLDNAFVAYKDAKTSYRLKIAIYFGAAGDFIELEEGKTDPRFLGYRNDLVLQTAMMPVNSIFGLNYDVLIEENRDGRIFNYKSERIESFLNKRNDNELLPWQKVCGNYVSTGPANHRSATKLIDFTEEALQNLQSITRQVQNAVQFITTLVTSDNTQELLNSQDFRLLTENNKK